MTAGYSAQKTALNHAGATTAIVLFYAAIFIPLERLCPSKQQPIWRKGSITDILYWLLQWPVGRLLSFALAGTTAALSLQWLMPQKTPETFGHWPAWIQALSFSFVLDVVQYWVHRGLHTRLLWRIHVVHHSSRDLDWLTAYRRHPLELWIYGVALLLVSHFAISSAATTLFISITAFTNYLPHANLNWT
jgi:sterol desaturase/sphingolipid hydroxylase (fatty acid hydroxylase superfamily)